MIKDFFTFMLAWIIIIGTCTAGAAAIFLIFICALWPLWLTTAVIFITLKICEVI